MASEQKSLGILVGGGPAPGINGVISAATIEARNNGLNVVGFYEGFKHLMAGREDQSRELTIDGISRIHFMGGSILRTSRANPTKNPADLAKVQETLQKMGIEYLLTIGGDDTAHSASKLAEKAKGIIGVAHVPKTIDNDLPLPASIPTFGFQTARHVGVGIVQNLMADAQTSARWYLCVAMGRLAGHLALGIGKAAAAPLTLIPEEFQGRSVTISEVCDLIEGAIIKRKVLGRDHGVAILAEGLIEHMSFEHLVEVFGEKAVTRDPHGHIRLADIEFGRTLRDELRKRFTARGQNVVLIHSNLGYELRSADPIPYDCEYTRDLGYGGVRFLLAGKTGSVITFHGGQMNPLPFEELRDPKTGRPRMRLVDVSGEAYEVAHKYMIRLDKRDSETPERLGQLAETANMSVEDFVEKFGYLMK